MISPPLASLRRLLLAASLMAAGLGTTVRAQTPPASLIANSGMETDADGDQWPDGWPRLRSGSTWENEAGNRFIRLTSTEPGKMVMLYNEIKIPEGTTALTLSWRQRVTGLKRGAQSWFDARIMLEFMDGSRGKVGPAPRPQTTGRDTDGWVERTYSFLVPEGAVMLKFMPALFNVQAGILDLDDVTLTPADPTPLMVAAEKASAAKAEKEQAAAAAQQSKASARLEAGGNLIPNGDFEKTGKSGDQPAGWPTKQTTWETEPGGNRFMRLTNTEPGKTVMLYGLFPLPSGVKALELSWSWRVTNLKAGKMPWHDARIMMDFKDASGKKLKPQPPAPYTRGGTKGEWQDRTVGFLVPEGAVSLEFMPSLIEVKSGTFDLDNIVLKPTDPEPLVARQKEREAAAAKARVAREEPDSSKWPKAVRVVGNKILDTDGGEVWLQGLNIPSLEWSVSGEQVLKSTLVAIDEWKSNVIRIPVKDEYWFGQGPQTDGGKSYRDIIDQMIVLASNRGAYVILDLHRYRAPRPEYLDFWKDAAARYKNHPALIFDLINEPHDTTWEVWKNGGFVGDKNTMDQAAFLTAEEKAKVKGFESPGMQAMLDAVRSTGAKNVVLVGALDYAYQLDGILKGFALEDKTGNGIIYASHVYPWKKGWQKYFLDVAEKHPILFGEVGADAKKMDFMPHEIQEDADTWSPAILGLIQKHKIHWTGWCFHPKATPRMILDWDYTPTPFWGQLAKDALAGKQFPPPDRYR